MNLKVGNMLGFSGKANDPPVVLLLAAVFCAFAPLELSQLIFTLLGAAAYSLLQAMQPTVKRSPVSVKGTPSHPRERGSAAAVPARRAGGPLGRKAEAGQARQPAAASALVKPEVRKPSTLPVSAPTFQAAGWEAETEELLLQIAPTPASDAIVQKLTRVVEEIVKKMIPEAEVVGFASGDLTRGKAFGVAVPDVDIVVNVRPQVLATRLQGKIGSQARNPAGKIDERKLQKSAIRICTDRLVAQGGFKFRRSAFRGQEPKVTLLAPAALGVFEQAIPVDFSVNAVMPLYSAALLTECGQIDARAKALILMVKRWAKDRGICHAAKGHLSPFGWSLLTIYFLQVGVKKEPALLPALEAFARSSGLMQFKLSAQDTAPAATAAPPEPAPPASAGTLFKAFAEFYSSDFDWRKEAVCVRLGRRGPPGLQLPIHIIVSEEGGATEVGPSIEDPFCAKGNLSSHMTAHTLQRLHEEVKRAHELCARGASLSELLEPWVPPEQDTPESRSPRGEDEEEDEPSRLPASAEAK